MKKFLSVAAAAALVQMAGPAGAAEPITQDATIFAVVDQVEGDNLTLRMLHSAMSLHAETILFVGDEIHATLLPLAPDNTRRAACVTAIQARDGVAQIIPYGPAFPRSDCIASVHDFRGAAGLPADRIFPDMVTQIMLNGDLIIAPADNHQGR